MSDWVEVCAESSLPEGGHRVVEVDDVRIAVFRIAGRFHAVEDVCTHDGGQLTGGSVEGNEVICPRHGARFDVTTGEALTPPAYEPVTRFPVRVENGVVQVRDDRSD